jgi:hypothetical protein
MVPPETLPAVRALHGLRVVVSGWSSRRYSEHSTLVRVLRIGTTISQRRGSIRDSHQEVRPTWTPHVSLESARDDVEVTYVMNPISLDVSDAIVDVV